MTEVRKSLPGLKGEFAPLGVGTWAWGDSDTWGMDTYDQSLTLDSIAEAWRSSLDAGVRFFDTAEVYGGGRSESIIGELLANTTKSSEQRPIIATKFMPLPQRIDVDRAMASALEASIERLGVERIDLYQVHGPISVRSHRVMARALARQVHRGLVTAVGVSNYSIREMTSIQRHLDRNNVSLASNQIEYSLLRRRPETSGLIDRCHQLGVLPLAYSPIGQGRLTGKYSAANPPPAQRRFSTHSMSVVDPLVEVLRQIGDPHDKTPAQVSLRWIIQKGAIPLPGAKNAEQATQNAGALGWLLTNDEMARLDGLALNGTRSLTQRIWQHG